MTPRDQAFEIAHELGFERVLTSGQAASALSGVGCIAQLVERAQRRISVMAGGSLRAHNIVDVVAATGVTEVHTSARTPGQSAARYPLGAIRFRASELPAENAFDTTDADQVRAVLAALEAGR